MKKELITIEKLSKFSSIELKTLSLYVRKGLLVYKEQDNRGVRYYDKSNSLKDIREIKRLEKEGFTSKEMKEFISKKRLFEIIEKLEG